MIIFLLFDEYSPYTSNLFSSKSYRKLLFLRTGNGPVNVFVKLQVVGRNTVVFADFATGYQLRHSFLSDPWLFVYFRIDNGHFRLERGIVDTAITLDHAHFVTVGPASVRTAFLEPGPVVITIGFDDKRITLPMADAPTHPARFRRFGGQFSPISPDRAEGVADFKKLNHSVWQGDEFKPIVVRIQTWPALGITIDLVAQTATRRVFRVKRCSVRSFLTQGGVVLLLSKRRQLRRIAESAIVTIVSPHASQIVPIKRVTLNLTLDRILPPVLVVLTSRARLPSRRKLD